MTEAKIIHLINPATTDPNSKIHAVLWDSATIAVCGQGNLYREVGGEVFRIYWPTQQAITCHPCRKAIIMILRAELEKLDATQLEEMFNLSVKLRGSIDVEEYYR